jgi:anaerobic magnesium-protoporphyrin IX monomethyl ester cyclase
MRIILINAPEDRIGMRYHPHNGIYPNLGIYSLFAFLVEEKHTINTDDILDGEILSFEDIVLEINKLNKKESIVAGFHTSITNYNNTKELSTIIKNNINDVIIIYGGPLASSLPINILENNDTVDYIIAGDGEIPLSQFLNSEDIHFIPGLFFKVNNLINIPKVTYFNASIENLPYPLKYIHSLDPYYNNYYRRGGSKDIKPSLTYFHKTGCSEGCSFCQVPTLGKIGRDRKPIEAWQEVLYLKNNLGVNHIYEVSDNILYNVGYSNWFKEFATLSKKFNHNHEVKFRFYASTNRIDEEMIKDFILAGGDTLAIGFESNDDEVLANNKAFFTTSKQNEYIFNLIVKFKIKLIAFFILGLPYETNNSLNKTFEFINKVSDYEFTVQILGAICTPLPNTLIWNKYIKNNNILRRRYYYTNDNKYVEPTWTIKDIGKDFIENCKDIFVSYDVIKSYQKRIFDLRKDVFSSWDLNEEF